MPRPPPKETTMKILLTAINAKYIHSNLAVYCLKAYAEKMLPSNYPVEVELVEFTINQPLDEILGQVYEREPDVLCVSCYIWNRTQVEALVRDLKKVRPELPIWLGGPEVSYDAEAVLERLPEVKGILRGEGEKTFADLCRAWGEGRTGDEDLAALTGITFRRGSGELEETDWQEPVDLSEVPFIYQNMEGFANRIAYYESSRGCPFSCSYCLSSIDRKLRFRSLSLVERELQFFLDAKVPQVKFVDRTFNCSHSHALAVWRYLAGHDNGVTNFHFEVSADLLTEEELKLMENMRPGLIQLEIGVQSTNPQTIREIRRTMDFGKLAEIVRRIHGMGNIHQHLDLIAGLPYEDVQSFARSFDDVYALKPQQLQLGFLKVLKGSWMDQKKGDYGLEYKSGPPYEVLRTRWLSYGDVLRLKGIEEMVETYYNSRQFEHTLEALEQEFASPFRMYEEIWEFYRREGAAGMQQKRSARYEILLRFVRERRPEKEGRYRELLTYDYYLRENAKSRPAFAGPETVTSGAARSFYEREERERRYLTGYEGYGKNQMRKMTHLECFEELQTAVLFDYQTRNPLNQEARTYLLDLEEIKENERDGEKDERNS